MATIESCPFHGSDAACSVIYACATPPTEKLGMPALQYRRIPVDNQMTRTWRAFIASIDYEHKNSITEMWGKASSTSFRDDLDLGTQLALVAAASIFKSLFLAKLFLVVCQRFDASCRMW